MFMIYVDDHEPAHVHVKDGGEAKVNLLGPDGRPEMVRVEGMTRALERRILRETWEHQAMLLRRWSDLHG